MEVSNQELESLIASCAGGDESCRSRLCEVIQKHLHERVSRQLNRQCFREDISDLVSTIMIELVPKLDCRVLLPGTGRAVAWLNAIAANHANSFLRTWYRTRTRFTLLDDTDLEGDETDKELRDRREWQEAVHKALLTLEDVDQQIAACVALGWTYDKVREHIGVTHSTYYRDRERVLRMLKRDLQRLLSLLLMISTSML